MATMYAVTNYSGSNSTRHSVWGTARNGTDYCCKVDDPSSQLTFFHMYGRDENEYFSLVYGAKALNNDTNATLSPSIAAQGGDDWVLGTSDDMGDSINGQGGDDLVYGGAGADWLFGGFGDDIIHGEAGNDVVEGYYGDDEVWGEAGDDEVCTEGDLGDYLQGGAGANLMWASYIAGTAPTGSVLGSSSQCGSTAWGSAWVSGTCAYVLTAEPSGCATYPR